MSDTTELTATIRVRMSASDAHYGGYLVNGAHMLALFGDVATELAILCDGDEGLLVGYENVEFWPMYSHDPVLSRVIPDVEKVWDIGMVGNLSAVVQRERAPWLASDIRIT